MNLYAKRLLKVSAAALVAGAALSAVALPMAHMHDAHGPGCHAGQDNRPYGKRHGDYQKRHAQHQAELKKALKIAPAQEAAWDQFVADTAPDTQAPVMPDRASWEKLTTPERLDKMQTLKQERDARMNRHIEAVKQFYAVLTPEQQKVFDQQHASGRKHRSGTKRTQ